MRRSLLRSERGQIVPLMIGLMVLILLGGMIVMWIGFGTSLRANAQTAADAAALAAEQNVVSQLTAPQHGPNGELFFLSAPDWNVACQAAGRYAGMNGAHILQCGPPAAGGVNLGASLIGPDAIVEVGTDKSMPSGGPDSGHGSTAWARASTDPSSQASPAVNTAVSFSCDAGLVSGPTFKAHDGQFGFFPDPKADYGFGCEPKLAGAIDKLAESRKLHLAGAEGHVGESQADAKDPAAVAHGCGDASTTPGIQSVPDSVLSEFGLVRPFPDHRDVVELAGVSCDQQASSVDAGTSGPIGFGNVNVHLVPMQGGPVGTFISLFGGGASSIGETALQVGCQIFNVWQALATPANGVSGAARQELLLVALMVAQDESAMGQNIGVNRTDPNQSVGVFQQISADGWGTIPEELNVTSAAAMFFLGGHIDGRSSTQGLLDVYRANPGLPTWALAQGTQHSGAGQTTDGLANYGAPANVLAAQQMMGLLTSGACKTA